MGLEAASFIPELNVTNPVGASDPKSQGDDHLRVIKTAVKGSFPNFVGTVGTPKSVSLTEDQINDASQKSAAETISGAKTFSGLVDHTGRLITDDSTTTRAGFNIPTGVAPTTPVEGDVWKTATDLLAYVNGVAKTLIAGGAAETTIFKFKDDDTDRTNSTLSDDPDLAGITLDADQVYTFEAWLWVDTLSSGVPDFKWDWDLSQTAQRTRMMVDVTSEVGVHNGKAYLGGVPVGPITEQILADDNIAIRYVGHIHTHATLSTTLKLTWAQGTTSGARTRLEKGSWVRVTKLGTGI